MLRRSPRLYVLGRSEDLRRTGRPASSKPLDTTRAFNTGEAFLASDAGGDVSRLLSDVNMPGINGLESQDRVRQLRPALPIIPMTALTDEALRRRALAGDARDLLRRPLAADDLIRCREDTIGP